MFNVVSDFRDETHENAYFLAETTYYQYTYRNVPVRIELHYPMQLLPD
ncbi:hypothetical protein IC229_07550 [Spirosoma sp. BT702]|uniref:Uncharacterized protein n=1 Tax=Spirosoma profusum TaxID=2771354 RepID=A0A927AMT9_9BACT|nr:hypothetical protein [Spirosoma profusum]MBD2700484.1 hypothetical protein [Spirosoma profusum]